MLMDWGRCKIKLQTFIKIKVHKNGHRVKILYAEKKIEMSIAITEYHVVSYIHHYFLIIL